MKYLSVVGYKFHDREPYREIIKELHIYNIKETTVYSRLTWTQHLFPSNNTCFYKSATTFRWAETWQVDEGNTKRSIAVTTEQCRKHFTLC